MTKIWGPRHGFVRLWAGPPAQRQLVRGLAATSSQDPQKGSKMVKIRVKLGSLRVPPRSFRTKGTNRHILARSQRFGLRRAQNEVKIGSKWHFHWPLIGKMTKIDFFNRKSGQNDQNLRVRAWVLEGPNRSSSPKAACTGSSRKPPPRTLKRVPKWWKLGQNNRVLSRSWERVLGLKADISWLLDRRLFEVLKGSKMSIFLLKMVQNHQKSRNLLKKCIKTEGTNPRFP